MKYIIAVLIITFACVTGSFLGVTIYEIINTSLLRNQFSLAILASDQYLVKLTSILATTFVGAIGQELIIPAQHKFTFWQFIKRLPIGKFAVRAGMVLAGVGIVLLFFITFGVQQQSLADFFVNDYSYRLTGILPAAFIFGLCYGVGRWKSFQWQFEG